MTDDSDNNLKYIFSTGAIRDKAEFLFNCLMEGRTHFHLFPEKIDDVVQYILDVTEKNYPDGNIPFHSRWGHFDVGGIRRLEQLEKLLGDLGPKEKALAKLDLVVISVLLDAGVDPNWSYREESNGRTWSRSEGLAVMSIKGFQKGFFSSDPKKPYQVDSEGLLKISLEDLGSLMQDSLDNPVTGLSGRLRLLHSLGEELGKNEGYFPNQRPGGLLTYWENKFGNNITASQILETLLYSLNKIWPSRVERNGIPLGDVWEHPLLGPKGSWEGLIPFHKLSQWLTYSLIELLEESGMKVKNVGELTALAEYRNGGLLVDLGLIRPKNTDFLNQVFGPDSEIIVEWRALTIATFDRLAAQIRKMKNFDEESFPLAKMLEGGTWHAGRKIAKKLREDGSPPFKLKSDGTVF
ncbi:MAG: DUF1688 family protein [Bdellovibrionota bacterium]|nr:DUF1688 family protein [Bdellovibrionota bacterium]|tara:strand:- start:306 stop:1529 length:1224 start_codon:yes stop_codon:yes gene_type:complete